MCYRTPPAPAPQKSMRGFSYAYVPQNSFDDSVGNVHWQKLKHLKADPDKGQIAVDFEPLVKTISDFFPLVHISRTPRLHNK